MSKKFYIGICCLALLATSVASGYTEDWEGYTGNNFDPWDGTPEFAASGWGDQYQGTAVIADISIITLGSGYGSPRGAWQSGGGGSGGAHLLDAPQGPNSTFVYTIMLDSIYASATLFFGSDELVAPQAGIDGRFEAICYSGAIKFNTKINDGFTSAGWVGILPQHDFYGLGWCEVRFEADTNASSRPTVVRIYYRDLEDDGTGPVAPGTWNQVDLGGTGGGYDLDMTGDDYDIEAIAFRADNWGVRFDNINATPEPVTLAILGAGGLLALLRRRR